MNIHIEENESCNSRVGTILICGLIICLTDKRLPESAQATKQDNKGRGTQ